MRAWLCRSAILAIVLAIAVLVPFGKILGAQASDLSPDLTPSRADLTEVNVASLGFDPEDSTQYIQAAIDSGVARVVVPNMGQDWIVRPLVLRSNLELIFEEGVVLTAKKGEYRGTRDSMFEARNVQNLVLRGYGATLQMHKSDYRTPDYESSSWRHVLHIRDSQNVQILGLTLRSSGGDGIYLGGTINEDIIVRDVVADDNHRQGMSVISAKNLLIENSVFKNTSGTAPMAGIDFEPNHSYQRLENIVVRNSVFEANQGFGITFALDKLLGEPKLEQEVSVLIENVLVRGNRSGIGVSYGSTDANQMGEIIIRNCIIEDSPMHGLRIQGHGLDVKFEDCTLHNVASQGGWFLMAMDLPAPPDAVNAIMRLDATTDYTNVYFDQPSFAPTPDEGKPSLISSTFDPGGHEIPPDWQIQRGRIDHELQFVDGKGTENGWGGRALGPVTFDNVVVVDVRGRPVFYGAVNTPADLNAIYPIQGRLQVFGDCQPELQWSGVLTDPPLEAVGVLETLIRYGEVVTIKEYRQPSLAIKGGFPCNCRPHHSSGCR